MVGFVGTMTEYSFLENTVKLERYLDFMSSSGFCFVSMADTNLIGVLNFIKEAKKRSLKPIIGLRLKIKSSSLRDNYILLYARNYLGYKNLVKLSSLSANKIISDEEIIKHNQGLILVTSGVDSDLDYYLATSDQEAFKKELVRLYKFTPNFYLGVMTNNTYFDIIYEDYLNLINNSKIKYLPLIKGQYFNDELYAFEELNKLSNKTYVDGNYALKTASEIEEDYAEFLKPFEYVSEFNELIEDYDIDMKVSLPTYKNDLELSSDIYLKELCKKGLTKRLIEINKMNELDKYHERLNYELDIISRLGYNDYFLIVSDYINYAKRNNIYVGPGRGSACSSLVSYCLNISDVDPLEYELLFERFLNPERVSMPDIDTDFEDIKREEVIDYVRQKYGNDHVSYISTFQTFSFKSAVSDLLRVNNFNSNQIELVTNEIDKKTYDDLLVSFSSNDKLLNIIKTAHILEGLPKALSIHPSGIIISKEDLTENIPLFAGPRDSYQAQFDSKNMEQLGYLKFDFLGLANLTIVKKVVELVKTKYPNFDLSKIDLEDQKTYQMLANKDTLGIFQIEGRYFTKLLAELKISSFNELVALLALYRPGPMSMIPSFIERKFGASYETFDPRLKPILDQTYGIIIYQEQVMRILQVVAKYSLGEADVIRRAISKKKEDVILGEREKFIQRAIQNGFKLEVAKNIYDEIEKFAGYGFNKGHSVAYALFVYQMAYLKANYFNDFLIVQLDSAGSDSGLTNLYFKLARQRDIALVSPDINLSLSNYVIKDNKLFMPLTLIKGINKNDTSKIIENRGNGYSSFLDFVKKNDLSVEALSNLVYGGAFDQFGVTKKALIKNATNVAFKYIDSSNLVYDEEEYDLNYLREKEKEVLGINVKYDLFRDYQKHKEYYKASEVKDLKIGKKANLVGIIINKKVITTKNGAKMCFVRFLVNNFDIEITVFPSVYEEYQEVLNSRDLLLANGMPKQDEKELRFILDKIKKLS